MTDAGQSQSDDLPSADTMPTKVSGMPVVSAFQIGPTRDPRRYTWRVILREPSEGTGTPPTYTVTRTWYTGVGGWTDYDAGSNQGFRGLPWRTAAATFAKMVHLDAPPEND